MFYVNYLKYSPSDKVTDKGIEVQAILIYPLSIEHYNL